MSLNDLGLIGVVSKTLIIDGDIVIYQPCCIFNDDTDGDRRQIIKYIDKKIEKLMLLAECDRYIMFVTTKFNFRDFLVDDYKANRQDVERPVNLVWAKRYCLEKLNTHFHKYLEADDLLGIHMKDDTVLWSLDKDLRQIPGQHLDDATGEVVTVTYEGKLEERGPKKKVYFDGTIGFFYQLLIGDSTDHIVGCGKRLPAVYKSGAKAGQDYVKRSGVGPKGAIKIILAAIMFKGEKTSVEAVLQAVIDEYRKLHGKDWQRHLETEGNLLWMVREQHGEVIKRWTYDGRDEYYNISEGVFVNG